MKYLILLGLLLFGMSGCAAAGAASRVSPTPAPSLQTVSLSMGYIPTIQHAPFFVAQQKGYFAQAGLKVDFQWGMEDNGVKLVGANQIPFALVSADQIIQARAQGIPIVYVANWYNAFPIEVVALKDKAITKPQDLIGKKVGLPCLCGASYTAWRALLYAQKMDAARITVQNIGFTQVAALTQGTVDAVVVYANNEPVQLTQAGKQFDEIKIWEYAKLVGNGLATNEVTLQNHPDLVRRFVQAMLKGIADSINNPDEALQISAAAVPEIGGANLKTSEAVLRASIPIWKSDHPGASRPEDWKAMEEFMLAAEFIHSPVDVTKAYTNEFVQ